MLAQIRHYLPLCWFDVSVLGQPGSRLFLIRNACFYFAMVFFIKFNMSDDFETVFEVMIEVILTFGYIGIVLLLNGSLSRYTEVATAILFCENVVAVLLVPLIFWLTISENILSYALMLWLFIWDLLMVAAIYKHTLNVNSAASLVVSLLYLLSTFGGAFAIYSLFAG